MKFTVRIGDYSRDGHNQSDTYVVRVPKSVTKDMIAKNYAENIKKFGFSPSTIASVYEENTIRDSEAKILLDHGFVPRFNKNYPELNWVFEDEDDDDYDVWSYSECIVQSETMLGIVMFFATYGLEDPSWELISPEVLFGGGSIEREQLGYGAFFN